MTRHAKIDAQHPADAFRSLTEAARPELFKFTMDAVIARYGLQYFMVGFFPEADKPGLLENLIACNWPQDLLQKYEKTDMFRESRIVAGLKKTVLPVASENLLFARAREEGLKTELLGIFYDDGFRRTLGLSLHDADRNQYLIMLSGTQGIDEDRHIATLIYDTMKALDAYASARKERRPGDDLTAREIECLRWSAAGKSSGEIAIIIGISTHTVNGYMKAAMRKLNCVNRVQAVAVAYRLRLF